MIVLVTGDRNFCSGYDKSGARGVVTYLEDAFTMLDAFDEILSIAEHEFFCDPEEITLIHGTAAGADTWSGWIAKEYMMKVREFPANWKIGRRAGPIRNDQMLAERPDFVAGFHRNILRSRGTRDCFSKAKKLGYHDKGYPENDSWVHI